MHASNIAIYVQPIKRKKQLNQFIPLPDSDKNTPTQTHPHKHTHTNTCMNSILTDFS